MNTKLIQLTNNSISTVAADVNMPLGVTTVIYPNNCECTNTYTITSSASDTIQINKSGIYKVIYNASLVATDAGEVVLSLIVNGSEKYTVTATATAAGAVNVTIPYEVYLPCNCNSNPINIPAYMQIKNAGVALTSGVSNIIISRDIKI